MPTVLICTWKGCYLEIVLHSLFTTNGKSKYQDRSDFSCGLTQVPKLHLSHQNWGAKESGEWSWVLVLLFFILWGSKGPWTSSKASFLYPSGLLCQASFCTRTSMWESREVRYFLLHCLLLFTTFSRFWLLSPLTYTQVLGIIGKVFLVITWIMENIS